MSVPDVLGPITGWRVWRFDEISPPGRFLQSLHGGDRWSPFGPFQAKCLCAVRGDAHHEVVPARMQAGDDPKCGIYVMQYMEGAVETWAHALRSGHMALGQVQAWGRTWPHENGWRTEYARPIALVRTTDTEMEREIADTYGIEVLEEPGLVERLSEMRDARGLMGQVTVRLSGRVVLHTSNPGPASVIQSVFATKAVQAAAEFQQSMARAQAALAQVQPAVDLVKAFTKAWKRLPWYRRAWLRACSWLYTVGDRMVALGRGVLALARRVGRWLLYGPPSLR